MKAAIFQGFGKPHKIETIAEPEPGESEVVLKIERSGVCGSDIAMTKPRGDAAPIGDVEAMFAPGAVLGHEYAGEVVALGKNVQRLKLGDRVAPMYFSGCGRCLHCIAGKPNWCHEVRGRMGGFAQYGIAHENSSVRLPQALSYDEGALIEPLSSSFHAVVSAPVTPGARVLVLGSGAIGMGVIYFARRVGAGRIVAVSRGDTRREMALAMGADHYLTQRETLADEAATLLNGPPDIVFDTAGVAGVLNQALGCVRPEGTVVVAGMPLPPDPDFHVAAMMKCLRVHYSMAYELHDFQIVADLLAQPGTPLKNMVTDWSSLENFPDAFEALRTRTTQLKLMLRPWQ